MKTDPEKVTEGCTMILLQLALAPFLVAWRAYVLTILWRWFIVTTFKADALTLVPAMGLSLIVSYLCHKVDGRKDERTATERARGAILLQVIFPAIFLLSGWIINHWMP